MKDFLFDLVRDTPDPLQAHNLVREYLQARILRTLQRNGAMIPLAFHGGTALRFLFGHSRFSEDLDFALEREVGGYDFRRYLQAIRNELAPEGYRVDIKINEQKTVHGAFVRIPGLLYELGISTQPTEVLAIKIEIDTHPPEDAQLVTTVIRRYVLLQLQHHDRGSLFAGKLHAILQRPFTKGRDLFDLFWYLSDPNWPTPNLIMLNNALKQSGWLRPRLTESDWRQTVYNHLQTLDWARTVDDVKPFLEPGFDVQLLTKANLESLLLSSMG